MEFKFIQYEKRDRVAYVTINRPERLNALHPPASRELREAFLDFRDDPDTLVSILTGAGDRAFCTGNDLKYHVQHIQPGELWPEADTTVFGGITDDFECWKPIIAAVNGYAMGGGLELALACDIIIASEGAQLGLPESRVGLVATAGGVHRLPRQIPLKIAMGMLLTGRPMTSRDAHSWGLVNEVVPLTKLAAAAERWAVEIRDCAPLSVRASKQMVMSGMGMPVNQAMETAFSELDNAMASADFVEGPRAFSEKRKPKWSRG